MLENTECAIKKGQSNETSNIGYTRRRKTKQKQYVVCHFFGMPIEVQIVLLS